MLRRLLLSLLVLAALSLVDDGYARAASCTPLSRGKCTACKNCRYCGHCAKQGGTCSVCK
jgi:hypothetical protein